MIAHLGKPLSRRAFLRLALSSAAVAAAGPACVPGSPRLPQWPFRLGVASGDPLAERVVIWTRLAPDPLAPGGGGGVPPEPIPVLWEVANDEAFQSVVRSGVAVADPSLAHSVHVDVNGLLPDRWYFYRFWADGHVSDVGRTRTFPAPDAAPALMRFASASCQSWQSGYYPAHAAIAQDDLDFVTFLGDYIYEGGISGDAVRPHDGPRITDLAGYRNRYALYKGDSNLQAAHRACPWIVTWDDHEVANNYAGLTPEVGGIPPQDFAALRAAGYQAWYEHQPVRLLPPKGSSFRIYRQHAFGDLASFFVLDSRQYRTDQECGGSLGVPCPGFPNPNGEMVGAAQEQWLLAGLAASSALWDVLAQQVVFAPTPLGQLRNFDQWDGYPLARERIVNVLRARIFRNAVVLTGDIHAAGAGWVPGDLTAFTDPVATELVATGIASAFPPDLAVLAELAIQALPHIDYFKATLGPPEEATPARGYVRHEVGRDTWQADFRFVDAYDPDSEAFTDQSFVVERGNPEPQPA
jgi:alkaline phosphatase D